MSQQNDPENAKFDADALLSEAKSLIRQFKTVQLATINNQGNPEASYTPYIEKAGRYYVFISALATHTNNIIAHPILSLFFIQNEDEAKNLFARRRLTLECSSSLIARESSQWDPLLDQFRDEHGPTVDVLRTLADFQLFELTPTVGHYVKGFGQAYTLSGDNLEVVTQSNPSEEN